MSTTLMGERIICNRKWVWEKKRCDILKQSIFESVGYWSKSFCSAVAPLLEPEALSDQEVP